MPKDKLTKYNLKNEKEHKQLIENTITKYKKVLLLEGHKEFSVQDLFKIFLESTRFITKDVLINGHNMSSVYGFDYDIQAFVPVTFKINKIVTFMASLIKMNDPKRMASQLEYLLHSAEPPEYDIEIANFAPSHIVQYKNGWLDLKTKEFTTNKEVYKDYHFVKHLNYNYRTVDECNPVMFTICKRVLSQWTADEEDFGLYLKQIWFSMIEGYGRQKVHILKSDGGDGKSTFMRIGKYLGGGSNYFVHANIDDFADDNIINTVSLATSGVIGDDLTSNAKFGGKPLGRFKTLVAGEPFQASMKYHANVIVQTNAVFIQGTNTDLSFYENSPAIQDRLIVNNWVNKNFRRNPVSDYNLDKLSGGKNYPVNWEFIETMNALIMDEVTYFNQYTVPGRSQGLNEEMVQKSDQVYLYVEHLQEQGLLKFRVLPMNVLYKHFGLWLKENNAGSAPMSARKFAMRITSVLSKFNYELKFDEKHNKGYQVRLTSLESSNLGLDFDLEVFETFIGHNLYVNKKSLTTYFVNEDNQITNENINDLKQQIINNGKIEQSLFNNIDTQLIINHLTRYDIHPEIVSLLEQ